MATRGATRTRSLVRSFGPVALLPAGVLAVHQLRYKLAYGSSSGRELAAQGHAYLGTVEPFAVLLVALGLGCLLRRVAQAWLTAESPGQHRLTVTRLWAATAVALLAVYAAQELVEGALASGHAAGLAGVFGSGGWIAVPAAGAVAAVITVLVWGGRTVLALAARRSPARPVPRPTRRVARPRPVARALRPSPLAGCAAGRAPPALGHSS